MSRPRVSNDNPHSESCFKTIKYQPDYPGRFRDVEHARRWCTDFFAWYATQHRHSGLALFTPADVFFGRVESLAATRQRAMTTAFNAHPQRFVLGPPKVRRPPALVAINPIDPIDPIDPTPPKPLTELLRAHDDEFRAPNPVPFTEPTPQLPGTPPLAAKPS